MLVDTHCHLPPLRQQKKLTTILERSREAGVQTFINIGTSIEESLEAVEVAEQYQNVYASVGIYPNEERKNDLSTLEKELEKLVSLSKKIVAIGECGMDITGWHNQRPIEEQKKLFQIHLKLACKYHLPLIIHNRKTGPQLLELLQSIKEPIRGVFHCFTGSKQFLNQVLELGFYIGITGLVTYDQGLQEVIKTAPLDRILLETDSPYLTPEPLRQTKQWPNEPKNVKIVAEKVAKLKGDSFISVTQQTTANAQRLFKLNER